MGPKSKVIMNEKSKTTETIAVDVNDDRTSGSLFRSFVRFHSKLYSPKVESCKRNEGKSFEIVANFFGDE